MENEMKKIPTLFERDWNGDRSRVIDKPHPACVWVFAGEGVGTQKVDGTCCMIRRGKLYRRRELKKGSAAPVDFEEVYFDTETGKTIGWVPIGYGPEDKWHREAFTITIADGTYELVGPHVQGNAEGHEQERLIPHSALALPSDMQPPRDFNGLRE